MKRFMTIALASLSVAFISTGFTPGFTTGTTKTGSPDLEVWIASQKQISEIKMFQNISPLGAMPGTILASPSKHEPNYHYYWVRDGALVMQSVFDLYEQGSKSALPALETFVRYSQNNQISAKQNLGEPRFNTDGSVNTEPWGRPQNDGPALRALLFTRFANKLLDEGRRDYVVQNLYTSQLPADSLIKTDLEFTAHHWRETCIDLWEEVWGFHFFTQASQLIALQEGAKLADRLDDGGAASFYRQQASEIEKELSKHWSDEKGYYLSTLEYSSGPDHSKPSQLDVSVILAALAAQQQTGILALSDDRILKTAVAVEEAFQKIYGLNRDLSTGTAIGRYPEDHYFGGNPWVLTTAAYAEMNLRLAEQVAQAKSFIMTETQARYFEEAAMILKPSSGLFIAGSDLVSNSDLRKSVVAGLQAKADRYLERVRRHANADGSLAEQFGRDNGRMLSARDLSWSYAAVLRAFSARTKATRAAAAL